MDALILSCGTGGGHDSAAKAIVEAMRKRGHRAELLNPYALKSDKLADNINKTYIAAAQNAPKAFGAVYQIGNLYRKLPVHSPVYYANRGMDEVMQKYLEENHFDIAIMTHLFPAEIFTNMKRHGLSVPKTVFVATDYACIPFTEETECDAYVIPAEDLSSDFINRGIPKEKLYPFGIPTYSSFASSESREGAKRRLGLDENKKYVLISGGSMGGGKIEKAITKVGEYFADRTDVGLIVVCGSNKALFDKLNEAPMPGVTVIAHTDDMALYMKASSLFITKPGGLSSTEAAVCGVPILHTSPIPGCESLNARYFSMRGMSIYGEINGGIFSTADDILAAADEILTDDRLSASMIESQKKHINPSAAADICAFAERLVLEREDEPAISRMMNTELTEILEI